MDFFQTPACLRAAEVRQEFIKTIRRDPVEFRASSRSLARTVQGQIMRFIPTTSLSERQQMKWFQCAQRQTALQAEHT